MSRTAARLTELGLALPPPLQAPGGIKLPFPWISVRGERVIISGHSPRNTDGALTGPFGKVGARGDAGAGSGGRARGRAVESSAACIGVAGLPFNIAVEIEGEVLLTK